MFALPPSLVELSAALSRLPGIGPRSAERLALHLAQAPKESAALLAEVLLRARDRVDSCRECGALTESQPCALCASAERDVSQMCLVEQPVDIIRFEKAGVYRGRYHVLGGKISPLDGVEPEDLRIAELEERLKGGVIREVIIALSSDVEGDATSHYLARRLSESGVAVSRLAHGLPAGSGLEFADEVTLGKALQGRRGVD